MFTRVKVKNYKSLMDLDVDLSSKKNVAKPLVIVYGENGIGKTNFANIFLTLQSSLRTMSLKTRLQNMFEEYKKKDLLKEQSLNEFLKRYLWDTETIIKKSKTINSKENMRLEFEFVISDKHGKYIIEYDNSKIVYEKLEYVLNKNKVSFYEINGDDINVNDKIFKDKEYYKEFYSILEKYNGKHSFLSALVFEIDDAAKGYVEEKISGRLYEVISSFILMSIRVKSGSQIERGSLSVNHKLLMNLDKGIIDIDEEEELNRVEEMINDFFTLAYSDIKQAYYKKEKTDTEIKYRLFFMKKIYNTIIDVDFELESTGTQRLLSILPYLLMSVEGQTVIIDELDTGIHDLLVNNILDNIIDSINGQLIVTTHNTMLLESDINPDSMYTFIVDKDAGKELIPITKFEDRAHPNLNYRNRYLKGMYGGIPFTRDIDYDELIEMLE